MTKYRINIYSIVLIICFILTLSLLLCSKMTALASPDKPVSEEEYHGYVEAEEPECPENIEKNEEDLLSTVYLPVSYDARNNNQVSSVKNQLPDGTCWSFSTMAALEGSLMSKRIHGNPDLSERHFIKYSFSQVNDPLGGTNNDVIHYLGNDYMSEGGNIKTYYHVLTNWKGAAYEGYAPYNSSGSNPSTADAFYHDIAHLQQFYRILRSDTQSVKKAIMEYGGVTNSVYFHPCYLNSPTAGYYTASYDTSLRNHAITIVGWDDTYSRSNFRLNPGVDGAWLVKDSFGTSYGHGGYVWISYAEVTLDETCCVLVGELGDDYNNIYQYDGSYLDNAISPGGHNPCVANVFTIPGKKKQELKAVSIDMESANVSYTLQIFKDMRYPDNPITGKPVFEEPISGTTDHSGYYTIKLPDGVYLNPNKPFAVVFYFLENDSNVYIREERSGVWNNTEFKASAKPNQSFISTTEDTWEDRGAKYGVNLRIKAFTNNTNLDADIDPYGIGLSYDSMILSKGESRIIKATVVPENATDKTVIYESSNPSVVTVDSKGNVKAVAPGTAVITGTTTNYLTSRCTVKVVINPTSIRLNTNSAAMYFGDSLELKAKLTPDDVTESGITWTVSNPAIASVNNGIVRVWGAGKLTVTAQTANKLKDKCEILVLSDDNPDNPFADVKSEGWQYTAAEYVYENGYMNGKGELIPGKVLFSPNTTITRSQFAQTLYNLEGKPETGYKDIFTDVSEGKWYTDAVIWAADNKIVVGKGERFDIDGVATREQLAVIFYKYAQYKGIDVTVKEGEGKELADFPDGNTASSWARDALRWALAKGIISGKGSGLLVPNGSASRAECAMMLKKFMEMPKETVTIPKEDEDLLNSEASEIIENEEISVVQEDNKPEFDVETDVDAETETDAETEVDIETVVDAETEADTEETDTEEADTGEEGTEFAEETEDITEESE